MYYLRALAAIVLTLLTVSVLAPYATNYISSRAVVNAPLNTVRSPIRGVIAQPSANAGTGIEAGATLVTIDLEEPDRRYLEQLTARQSLLRETLAAIETEAAALDAMQADMAARIEDFRTRMIDRLAAEAAEAQAEVSAAEARLANAEAVRRRSIALAARGHASETRSEADTAARDEAAGNLARLHAVIGKIEVERNAADRGALVRDSASDVPYSQQHLDEIRMRSTALGAEHQRVSAELSAPVLPAPRPGRGRHLEVQRSRRRNRRSRRHSRADGRLRGAVRRSHPARAPFRRHLAGGLGHSATQGGRRDR